jgi:uracil DNA glycosylase
MFWVVFEAIKFNDGAATTPNHGDLTAWAKQGL